MNKFEKEENEIEEKERRARIEKIYEDLPDVKKFYDDIKEFAHDITKLISHSNSMSVNAYWLEEAIQRMGEVLAENELQDAIKIAKDVHKLAIVAEESNYLLSQAVSVVTQQLKVLFWENREVRRRVKKVMQGMTTDQEIAFAIFCIKELSAKGVLSLESTVDSDGTQVHEIMQRWNAWTEKWLSGEFLSEKDMINSCHAINIDQVCIDRRSEENSEVTHRYHHFSFLVDSIQRRIGCFRFCGFEDQNPMGATNVRRTLISTFLGDKCKFDKFGGIPFSEAIVNICVYFSDLPLEKIADVAKKVISKRRRK